MDDVWYPFSVCLNPGSTSFVVKNPGYIRDDIERLYSMAYLTIKPDYFSKLASENNLDDEIINPVILGFNLNLYTKVGDLFYAVFDYTINTAIKTIQVLVDNLNEFFVSKMPQGMIMPPIMFDWTATTIDDYFDDNNFEQQMDLAAILLYGEPIAEKYKNKLHSSAKKYNFNTYALPTVEKYFNYARIRMIIAPNLKLSFSSDNLLTVLGFSKEQIGERGAGNRYHFVNNTYSPTIITAANAPEGIFSFTNKRDSIYVSKIKAEEKAVSKFNTTRAKYQNVQQLTNDLNDQLSKISKLINMKVGVEYDKSDHKVKFTFPNTVNFECEFEFPNELNEKLGFPVNTRITKLNRISAEVSNLRTEAQKLLALSEILTKDTGHVLITLDNVPSLSTRIYQNQLMSVLYPLNGELVMEKSVIPNVYLPQKDNALYFSIHRFSENGLLIPLSWNISCYVEGCLYGKKL